MTQLTLTAAREALAGYLAANITGLRTVTTRLGQINPPCALVLPAPGTFATYSVSMDGQVNWTLRVLVVASLADSESGQDILDPYLSVTGPKSIWAAVDADSTLGGAVDGFAVVVNGSAYGVTVLNGVDYLTATLTVQVGD